MLYENIEFPADVPVRSALHFVEEYPFHIHKDVLEIILVLEGSFELTVVNNLLTMNEGDIYICGTNELHRLHSTSETPCIVLLQYIDLTAYKTEFPDINTYQFANSALKENMSGMKILGNFLLKQLPLLLGTLEPERNGLFKIGEEILSLLIRYFQCYFIGNYFPEFNNVFRDNEIQLMRIRRIIDYIYTNYNKPIKIEDVASMEHISTNYLTHILKNGCGVGFRMFVNMARVEQSARLLLENEKSLQTIALDCGFSKQKYFDGSFEKVFRMTPMKYRETNAGNTIAGNECKMPKLHGNDLHLFLKKFCGKSAEISLDLHAEHISESFLKPDCICISGFRYDHITDFPLLKKIKEDICFNKLGIDMEFLRLYKKDRKSLKVMLSDFWTLNLSLRLYVDNDEDIKHLHSYLEAVKSICNEGKMDEPEVVVSSRHFNEQHDNFPGIGYIPCSILHSRLWRSGAGIGPIIDLYELPEKKRMDPALLTKGGLFDPAYHLLYLLKRMDDSLVATGDMYYITQTPGTDDFQILVYFYNENPETWFDDIFKRDVRLNINNIKGKYILKRYRMASEEYVFTYNEAAVLSGESLSEETLRLLNGILSPKTSLNMLELDGSYNIDLRLDPFEIVLLSFERI